MELAEIQERLKKPFDIRLIKFKPGSVFNGECTPLAFVSWHNYLDRLDQDATGLYSIPLPVVTIGPNKVCVTASVLICGHEFSSIGDAAADKDNGVCDAEDQAFKRACAKVGLGRYLYDAKLPSVPFENKRMLAHNLVLAISMYDQFGFEIPDEIREEAEQLREIPIKASYKIASSSGTTDDTRYLANIKAKLREYNQVPDHVLSQLKTVEQAKQMQQRFINKEDRDEILAPYMKAGSGGGYRRPWQN